MFYPFFFSVKSKYYIDSKRNQMYTAHEQKETKTKTKQNNKPKKPYLLPNHVRKSRTKCVLSTLYRLAQVHKLETKVSFNPLGRGDLVLEHQPISRVSRDSRTGTEELLTRFFCVFYPQQLLAKLKWCEGPIRENPTNPYN